MVIKISVMTPTEFGKKFNVSRATVWRWMNLKKYSRYLKMYDAEVEIVAGKKFVKVTTKKP